MNWTFPRLMDLAAGYWGSAALSAAVELGVFGALPGGARPEAGLAAELGVPERHLGELLQALCALGLIEREAGRVRIAPGAAPFLDPSSPVCQLDALRFNADLYPLWGRLADSIRRGAPAIPPGAHLGSDPARTRRFALGMNSRALALAPHLLPALEIPESGRLLDLACGAGTFGRLLAEARPGLRVTQFDLPPVLETARELAASSPAAGRVEFHPGHYLRDELPGGFDAVLYCGGLHQETPSRAAELFRRIAGALRPGGRLILADLMLDAGRTGPAFAALFSLNMMLTSPDGRVFDTAETETLLRDAGFPEVRIRPLPDVPYTVAQARREGAAGR